MEQTEPNITDRTGRRAVTVYCASSPDAPAPYLRAAFDLGRELAEAGLASVSGAGRTGLMGEVVSGTLSAGGKAIGVIPRFMVERGWANPLMSELHVTADMHERKRLLAHLGCGAIALPGGLGTLDELMDLLTQCQLGLYDGTVVILNIDGFYDRLLAQLEYAEECSMMRHLDGRRGPLWHVATSAAEAVSIILDHESA